MRVLLVSQEMPPETGWGGIGTYIAMLAPALVERGAEVHVLSVVRGQDRSTCTTADGVVVHRRTLEVQRGLGRLSGLVHTWSRLSIAMGVARAVRQLDVPFDVAECPDWNAEGLLLVRRQVLPVVVRLHSSARQMLPYIGPMGLDARLAVRLEDAQIRRAEVVTGTTPQLDVHRDLIARAGAEAVRITCPVSIREAHPLPEGPPTVCFVGRFEPRKNPEVLVRALPHLRAAVPEVRLRLVGRDTRGADGRSVLDDLRRLAGELGVADRLDVHEGWASPDEVIAHLTAAAVCAVPSRWESFGYVAAEAGSLGRPVVASAIPALAEVVEDGVTGRLVPVDDAVGWASALGDIVRQPRVAESMGRAAAARIRARNAPEIVAGETMAAYERAIERRQRQAGARA